MHDMSTITAMEVSVGIFLFEIPVTFPIFIVPTILRRTVEELKESPDVTEFHELSKNAPQIL